MLAYAVEDFFFKGKKDEAYTICVTHSLIEKGLIKKKDILE